MGGYHGEVCRLSRLEGENHIWAYQIDAAQEQEGQNRIEEANCGWEEGIFENSTVDESMHSSEKVPEHHGLRPHQWKNESGQGALRQGQVLVQRVILRACRLLQHVPELSFRGRGGRTHQAPTSRSTVSISQLHL